MAVDTDGVLIFMLPDNVKCDREVVRLYLSGIMKKSGGV